MENIFDLNVNLPYTIKKVTGFDIPTIWQIVFGYKGLPFPAKWLDSKIPGLSGRKDSNYQGENFNETIRITKDKENKLANLGSPLYSTNVYGSMYFMPVWLNNILLPICTIGISGRKTIIETPLTGHKGTVKELIRNEDYNIKIDGICFSPEREFPEEQIQNLKDLYEINKSVTIQSALTDIFLKDCYVVITDIDFPAIKGVEHIRPFTMNLLSDEQLELIIE